MDTYTGVVQCWELDFNYIFNSITGELKLVYNKEDVIDRYHSMFCCETSSGVFEYRGDLPYIAEEVLEANCNEMKNGIIFIPQSGKAVRSVRHNIFSRMEIIVEIIAYIEKKTGQREYNKAAFDGVCLNHIYPPIKGYRAILSESEKDKDKIFELRTEELNRRMTDRQELKVDNMVVSTYYTISPKISFNITTDTPVVFQSNLVFEFSPTDNYRFTYMLAQRVKLFLGFLTFQREIGKFGVSLYYKHLSGYLPFGEMYIVDSSMSHKGDLRFDSTHLARNRYIEIELLDGIDREILQDIIGNALYLRHLPYSNRDKLVIDESKFVLTTAAFEYEFNRLYPEGIPRKEASVASMECVNKLLSDLIDEKTGKVKKILRNMQRDITNKVRLQEKIKHAVIELDEVMKIFVKLIYGDEETNYNLIGQRIGEQRNRFAHGKIDINEHIGYDVNFLRCLLLAMQLRKYNASDDKIKQAISSLFGFVI